METLQTTSVQVADAKEGKFVRNIVQGLEDVMRMRQSNVRKVGKKRQRIRHWKRFISGKRLSSRKLLKSVSWERTRIVATRCFDESGSRILSVRRRDVHIGKGCNDSPKKLLFQLNPSYWFSSRYGES